MAQLENIEAIEARLWRAADLLRQGSEFASNEYFMPVMGLIFLRHAYSRFLAVKPQIEKSLPSRHGVIRSNFFYPRTVPCELWFLNKAKPAEHRDKVLMLDARGVYRKVTRKIYDFSPEQLQNLLSIVWLYRGQPERFRALVASYLNRTRTEAAEILALVAAFEKASAALEKLTQPFLRTMAHDAAHATPLDEFQSASRLFQTSAKTLLAALKV